MFRPPPQEVGKTYRLAIAGLLLLSAAALVGTIWVMVDFLREQVIVDELIQNLPESSMASAKELAGELRWQFRLSILVALNLVVTGFAVVLLWRAYRASLDSLRDFKALASDILGGMSLGVVTTDSMGTITSINKQGLEFLSPNSDCVGKPLAEISNRFPLESFRLHWCSAPTPGMIRDFRVGDPGGEKTLRAFCQSLSNYEGKEIGNVLQLRDVTERVFMEDRLRRLERYMGLGSLAAGLHHEIKNPLAALSLHVQLLEEEIEGKAASEEASEMLRVIKTEVDRIGGVLEGFRDFASLGQLNLAEIDMHELVDRQAKLITPRANQIGVRIVIDVSASSGRTIVGDRVRLEQVLLNLLINGLEAMPDGGLLTISVSTTGDNTHLCVSDTGGGIPANLQARVLDPYFTTKSSGTGLGLAICDKIARQHSGSLHFQTDDSGTTFQLTLPTENASSRMNG